MRLWKKIVLILIIALLLAQIPLVYRRVQTGNLAAKISSLDERKRQMPENPKFGEFAGVVHVHSSLGGHSTGDFDELIDGARRNNLDFVVMTEHTSQNYDSSSMTLRGVNQGILFVGGNEANTKSDDRFLIAGGFAGANSSREKETPEFVAAAHAENKLAFAAYPETFKSWDADFDGVEVFNLFTNAKQSSAALFAVDALWSFPAYPELTLAKHLKRPDANLQKFDAAAAAAKKITLFAGSDAHSNVGFHFFGDDAGHKFINIKLDRYETLFRLVRTHVLIEKGKPLTEENLLEALKNGRAFVGFDCLGDTRGFSFAAENGVDSKTMGDEIALAADGVNLKAAAAQTARFVVFKNGEKVFEQSDAAEINFRASEPGTYRTEVYLDALGAPFDRLPWTISNPIYVK